MNLETLCPFCENTGIFLGSTCGFCDGTTILKFSGIKLPDNHVWTFEILEATDDSEYAALSSANKAVYALIISAGMVDGSSGTAVRSKLLSMFGPGSTTRTNLIALIGE